MKIIVRGTNWVGDAVMQIPALRRIRRAFPEAQITLATRSWAKGIFEDADFIDGFLVFEKKDSVFKQAKKWRDGRFDLAIILTNSFESALVAKLGGVKKRFGYATEGRSFLLTDSFPVPDWKQTRHEIFYYLNLVEMVEKIIPGNALPASSEPEFALSVSDLRRQDARALLEKRGADLSRRIVAFCPGSTNSRAKRWHSGSYAALNDLLQTENGALVLLVGSGEELEVSTEVFEKSEIKPLVLTGETSLAELTAVLSLCDLLVTNDTGPAHIASALGTATIVIFGPTNPETTRPLNALTIRKPVECSPCLLRDCPIDHRCMTSISPAEVFAEARRILNDG